MSKFLFFRVKVPSYKKQGLSVLHVGCGTSCTLMKVCGRQFVVHILVLEPAFDRKKKKEEQQLEQP